MIASSAIDVSSIFGWDNIVYLVSRGEAVSFSVPNHPVDGSTCVPSVPFPTYDSGMLSRFAIGRGTFVPCDQGNDCRVY